MSLSFWISNSSSGNLLWASVTSVPDGFANSFSSSQCLMKSTNLPWKWSLRLPISAEYFSWFTVSTCFVNSTVKWKVSGPDRNLYWVGLWPVGRMLDSPGSDPSWPNKRKHSNCSAVTSISPLSLLNCFVTVAVVHHHHYFRLQASVWCQLLIEFCHCMWDTTFLLQWLSLWYQQVLQ